MTQCSVSRLSARLTDTYFKSTLRVYTGGGNSISSSTGRCCLDGQRTVSEDVCHTNPDHVLKHGRNGGRGEKRKYAWRW